MDTIPLTTLREGDEATIISVFGGMAASKRLADLGLTPGTILKVIKKAPLFGPIVVRARGSRLILGRGLALKVFVEKEK
jgi:ferrous iron transport protein A